MQEMNAFVKDIMDKMGTANVDAVFGESRQFEDKVVIPVGKVMYGWGGGYGQGPGKAPTGEGQPRGEGEGGAGAGMGVMVKPIGFITVTADKVKYDPIVDVNPFVWILAPMLGLALLKMVKLMSWSSKMRYKHGPMMGKHSGGMHGK